MFRTLIVLSVLLTVCCDSVNTANHNGDQRRCRFGSIFPRDPLVLSGQNLTLTCNGPGTGEMWFERGTDAERVPEEYVKKLNRTAIQLDIPISEEDVKNSWYSVQYKCMMEKRNGEKRCVDNIYVEMDYYPIEPKNLDCRVLDFETMNCTWDLGIKYKHEEHMNITCVYANLSYDRVDTTLLFKSDNFGAPFAQCPDLGTNWCYWNESEYTSPFQLLVKVVVRNKKNNITVETTLTRHELDMVEPAGVKDLQVIKTDNPRQWVLQWEPTKVFHNYVFNVTVTSACSEKLTLVTKHFENSDPDGSKVNNITIGPLKPYTNYTFSVKARIIDKDNGYAERGHWSKGDNVSFMTASDVVDKNPVTALGLYELTSVQDEQKLLTVYFTPLPVCDLHTDQTNVEYIVQSCNSSITVKHPSFSAVILVSDLPVLNVTLWAKNDIRFGSNVDPQLMTLNTFGPAPSELIVEYNKTGESCTTFATVAVQDDRSQHTNINHTVVWCKGNQRSCSEPLQWKELNSNITQFTFPSNQCDEYRYGLVTHGYHKGKGQTGSTGIQWQSCIYLHGKVPDKQLENVEIDQNPTSRGFTLRWQKYDCKAYITYYTVRYCKADHKCECRENPTSVNVSRLSTFSVSDLQAGSTVCAWVEGFSKYGIGPYNNKAVTWTVTEVNDANTGGTVGITLGVLAFMIIASLGVWFLCKKYKGIKDPLITVPDPLQNHISSATTPLVDTDEKYNDLRTSGIGTSPIHTQFTTDTELPSISESASLLHSDRLENHGGFHSPSDRQRLFDSANNFSANDDSEDSDEASELTGYNKPKNIDINVVDDSGSPKHNHKPKNINTKVADDSSSLKCKKPKILDTNVADDSGSPKRDLESYSKVALSVNGDTDNVSVSIEHKKNSFSQNKLNKEAVELNDTDIIKDTDNSIVPLNFIHDEIDRENNDNIFAARNTEKESMIENKDIAKVSEGNLFSQTCTQHNTIFNNDGGGCDKQTRPYRLKQGQKNESLEDQKIELMMFNSLVINDECVISDSTESPDKELESETAFDSSLSIDNKLATGYRGVNDGEEFGDSSDDSESESKSESKSETSSHDLMSDCNRDSTNTSELCPDNPNHNGGIAIELKEDDEPVEEELVSYSPTSSLDGYNNSLYSSLPSKLNGSTNGTHLNFGTFKQNVDDNCKEDKVDDRSKDNYGNFVDIDRSIETRLDFTTFKENVDDCKEIYDRGLNLSDVDGSVESVSDHSEDQLPHQPPFDNTKRNSNEVGSSDESRNSSLDSEPVNYLAAHMSSDTEKTDPVFKPKIIIMVVDQNSKTPTKNTNGHFKNQTPAHTNGISHLSKSHS